MVFTGRKVDCHMAATQCLGVNSVIARLVCSMTRSYILSDQMGSQFHPFFSGIIASIEVCCVSAPEWILWIIGAKSNIKPAADLHHLGFDLVMTGHTILTPW